jgi:hypothetical protein
MVKKILFILALVLILIQFIRPARNVNTEIITSDDISRTYAIPDDVHTILISKCYDCHSNHTNYPWYFNFQPIAWWLASHIKEAKEELNFSDFNNYTEKRAKHKLEELGEVLDEGTMPLKSYVVLHPNTSITPEDKKIIFAWLESLSIDLKHAH